LSGEVERLVWAAIDEVEDGAALHLDRRARVVRKHEDRRVEWRVRPPPAAPLLVGADPGPRPTLRRAELAPAHDLGADVENVLLGEGVVDTRAATSFANHRAPESGGEHPLVQTLPGVPERGLERETVAGAESVKRDREVMHADLGHATLLHVV
jgi:hypothetical protein